MKKYYDTITYKWEELVRNWLVWENESYTLDEYTVDQIIQKWDQDITYTVSGLTFWK